MKVLFDFDGFRGRVGGVARCTVDLIKHFPTNVEPIIAIDVCDNVHFIESNLIPNIKPSKVRLDNFIYPKHLPGRTRLFKLLERDIPYIPTYKNVNKPLSIAALKGQNFDLFHCPSTTCDTYFLNYLAGKPFVLTVHDMISELFCCRDNLQTKIKSKLLPLASHVVTISNQSKSDLMRLMNVPDEKISVIYHGAPKVMNKNFVPVFSDPYFLFVGRRTLYKNFVQTLIDFSVFHQDFPEVRLVTTGDQFTKNERLLIKELGLCNSVSNLFATEEELASLYKYAIAFIFPSLYEGFGLPVLESFAYGCPTLLNDTSCFPEIGKDAAIYFHSRPDEKYSDLPDKMRDIYLMSKEERNDLILKGLKRSKDFSWESSSKQLAEVYEKVLS